MKDLQRQIDQNHASHAVPVATNTPQGSVRTAFAAEGFRSPPGNGRDPIPNDGQTNGGPKQ
jgi:hypothetical protein